MSLKIWAVAFLLVQVTVQEATYAQSSEPRRLPIKVLDPPAKRMRGLWVNRVFVVDEGKSLLIKGVLARKDYDLIYDGKVVLSAADTDEKRNYEFTVPHSSKELILEITVRHSKTQALMSDSFGLTDDQFDETKDSSVAENAGDTSAAPVPVAATPPAAAEETKVEEPEAETEEPSQSLAENHNSANVAREPASQKPCRCPSSVTGISMNLPDQKSYQVRMELGMSSLKGTDITTKKTANLVSPTDMSLSFEYYQTFFGKVHTMFSYGFWMMNRLEPDGGWALENGNVFLDRPRVAGIYQVWPELMFYPGLSYGEFENVQITNNTITLTKSREISLDFGLTYYLYNIDPVQLGLIVDGSSLAFIDGGSRLKLGVVAKGLGELSPYSVSFSYNEDSVSHNAAKQSTTRFSLMFGYEGGL